MKKVVLFLMTLSVVGISYAEKGINESSNTTNNQNTSQANKTGAGDCNPPTSQIDLDINNVRTRILNNGGFWWDGNDKKYEIPKRDPALGETPIHSIFAGGLWISGFYEGSNTPVVAASLYNQGGNDFYAGPLYGNEGITNADNCNSFDKHFEVFGAEITSFRANFAAGLINSNADIPSNILKWPGKGNPYYADNETELFYNEGELAPYFDVDANGVYNPIGGDFPVLGVTCGTEISPNFADQMIFWVINDAGNIHGETGSQEIGMQVNCMAYAYATSDALNNMTFYTFQFIKKSPKVLTETYMSIFCDADLGDYQDDRIGCDTVREMAYVYNGGAQDLEYGANPPITGIDFFEGPIDENGNQLGLSSFIYWNLNTAPTDPQNAQEYRGYQEGTFRTGNSLTFGGNGQTGSTITEFCYPGNPFFCSSPGEWSELNADQTASGACVDLQASDRRLLLTSGPFDLIPGQAQRITTGVFTVFPTTYDGRPDIEKVLGPADDLAQSLFNNCFDIIDGPDAPDLDIRELDGELVFNLVNSESSNNFAEGYEEKAQVTIFQDSTYKFQGYKVYQLRNPSVSAIDLDDPTKAALIFQTDLKDTIANIFNYIDEGAPFLTPTIRVEGANEGINKSFVLTEDAFGTETNNLINNRKYYFMVVAYAYNNFLPVSYPLGNVYQDLPYLQGRNNVKVYSAIPHVIDSRNGGTILQAEAGDPIPVFRYEGQGNAGVAIKLAEATKEAIYSSFFEDILEYDLGNDPLQATVVDPLKLQNVDFELVFESFELTLGGYIPSNVLSDSVAWKVLVTNDQGQLIETIQGEKDFEGQYQQIFADYGISVNLNKVLPVDSNLRNGNDIYNTISASIEFEDPTKEWLTFVKDEGLISPRNWIRGGFDLETTFPGVYDSHQYDELPGLQSSIFMDPIVGSNTGLYSSGILEGSIAPYCLASNYGNPSQGPGTVVSDGLAEFLYGPAFRWETWDVAGTQEVKNPRNTLDKLASIVIVISDEIISDCVIFETGETSYINGSPKGDVKREAGGIISGQFPGYAINLETGERLNIAFGEASDLSSYRGSDGRWNPTADIENVNTEVPGLDGVLTPIWGGMHYVYVFNTPYDGCSDIKNIFDANPINSAQGAAVPVPVADIYDSIMYTFIPIVNEEFDFVNYTDIPTEATIHVHVERPLASFETFETLGVGGNSTRPRYRFSTIGLAPLENQTELAESVLDDIRVVPNPYYAFSNYEENQIDSEVKIIGLPDRCEISIFSLDGKLVRQFDRAVGNSSDIASNRQEIASGQPLGNGINLDNSVSWNLNNQQRIPVGSGTYIIHINAFDLGEKVVKAAIFMRPTDVSNF